MGNEATASALPPQDRYFTKLRIVEFFSTLPCVSVLQS